MTGCWTSSTPRRSDALCRCWVKTVFARMPGIHRVNGRPVLLGDGLKIPKRGRKMPAVKLLHQVSDGHTKPEYIMGHSFQVVSGLVWPSETWCRSFTAGI